ncbi:MAG: M23 family metallopeptidase [Desulfobacteraceae bacterium]|jgi:hypothetical protein
MNAMTVMNRVSSFFFNDLVGKNGFTDFESWFFYSGMMFGSDYKWWGKGGTRPDPHEGLDICYYKNKAGDLKNLDEKTMVPVMFDGVVFEVSNDDYLGKSIFVRHDVRDKNDFFLHSVYAHANPVDGLTQGTVLGQGDIIARVSDIRDRKLSIPGHLHVSMVFLPEDYPKDMLKWSILAVTYQARLVDPFGYLECNYTVEPYPC